MLRFTALNEDSDDESEDEEIQESTKEAQEAELFDLYNKALVQQRAGKHDEAQQIYEELLKTTLLAKSSSRTSETKEGLVHPGVVLQYSALKNLAGLAAEKKDYNTAMEYYIKAVDIDCSDVSIWYKMGKLALQLHQLPLARLSYEQALSCNSNHWPSLDQLCTLLYAMNDYYSCMHYISKALERDSHYTKGLVLRDKMYQEQPCMKRECELLFKYCDVSVFDDHKITKEIAETIVEEAVEIRKKKRELLKPIPIPAVKFPQPLASLTWKSLGENLISLYEYINKHSKLSFGNHVDVTDHLSTTDEENMPSTDEPTEMETESENNSLEKSKKGVKRKRAGGSGGGGGGGGASEESHAKRRSARVRNTVKKKEETVNYKELLRTFLPSSLKEMTEDEEDGDSNLMENKDSLDASKAESDMAHTGTSGTESDDAFISAENQDIKTWLQKHEVNNGVVDLMTRYCLVLAQKSDHKWPNGLGEVYVEVHKRLRNHLTLPSYYCKSISNQFIKELALMALVNAEQTLEKWLSAKMKSPVSGTTASLLGNSGQESFPIGTHDLFSSDLLYLESLSTFRDILTNTWLHFAVRVYWLKSRYLMLQGKRDLALSCFDYCSHLLTLGDSDLPPSNIPIVVHLPNCKDDIISARAVKKQVESLQRCQSLEEVQRLYETGNYQDVVDILYPTLTQTSLSKSKLKEDSRPARLLLLIESLLHTKNYELCVSCCLLALNESLQQLSNGSTMAVKENWLTTMTKVFQFLNKCLSVKLSVISQLARISVIQLTNTVIRIIELAMDSMDATDQPVISTVLPWVILYRLIKHEEDSFKAQIQHDEQKEMKLMPSSLMLLYRAHEYLGGRGWCCNSDGYLLTFYVDVLQEELKNREDALRQDMCLALEQCLYCLYGHPNKKAKARHLQDHGVEEVPLTWGKAVFVFDYFKPKTVPDFDSYKTSSMSGELESLFLKISKVIPVQKDPPVTMDTVNAYIEGISDKPPSIPEDKPVTLHVVKELFYLLADYYFKNKEWGKAIKFYMHDICVCPDRFDSWAGQALARSSRLEAKLSSCDVKNEGSMQKNAQLALRCFQRALEVDPSNYTLWIEYGSLAYTLHSHFSRQLKQQKTQVSMVSETIQCLTNKKNEMLSLAKKCFLTADKCEDDGEAEEWLIQYMLGKIAEKQKDKPLGFLEYYKKASCHLHDDEACYPKKIHYHNPPDLAMEALEVYYRLHAAVLKLLQEHDKEYCIDYQTLERCLIEAANSPFAKGLQKESDSSSLHSIQDSSKPTYTATPMDHDYVLSHTKTKLNISESSQSNKQHVIAESSQGDKQQTVSEISQGEKQHAVSEIGQGDKQHVVSEIGQGEKQQAVSEISQSDKQHAVSEIGQGDKQQTKHEDKPQMDEQQMLNQCGELLLQLSELQQPETEVFRNLESLLEETKKEQQDELTHQPEKETHSLQQSDTQSQGIKQSDKQFPQGPHAEQPMEQSEDGDIALWKDNEQFIEQMKNKTEPQIQSMLELEELVLVLSDSSSDIDGKLGSAPPPPPPPAASSAGSPKTANTSKPTKTDKGITPGDEEKRLKLVNLCIEAMKLCLTRFPQHYKSLYRLSRFYLYAETHKNIQWSRDLLMGTSYLPWYQYKHMPAQGLFAERNKSNFFNGIWRIPVEEIDRPGSFPSHMHRSVTLLLEVLLKNKDYKALFQVSSQLQRTPDQGKKYLRDVDRILLAKVAYDNVLAVIKGKLERMDKVNHCEDEALQLLLESYRVWQYGSAKLQTQMDTANRVLGLAYTVYKRNQLSDSSSPLEQAIRYCSGYSSLHRQPQTPTYGDFSLHFPTKATGKEDADVSSQKKSDQLVTPSDEPKSNKRKLEAIDIVAALESSSSKKSQDVVMKTPEKTSSRSPTFSSSPGLKLLQKAATSFQESFIASQALAKSLSPVKLTPSPTLTSAQVLTTIPTVTTSQSKVSSLADSKKEQGALSSQSKHSLSVPITTTDSAKPPSNTTPDVQSPSSGYSALLSEVLSLTNIPCSSDITPASTTSQIIDSSLPEFKGPPSVVSAPPMKALPGGHVSTSKLGSPSAAVNVLPDHKAGSAIMPPYNPRPYTSAFTASEEYRPPSTTVIVSPASSSDAASILQAHGPLSSSVSPSRPPSQSRMAQASPSKVGFAGLSAKQLSGIAESRDFGSLVNQLVENLVGKNTQEKFGTIEEKLGEHSIPSEKPKEKMLSWDASSSSSSSGSSSSSSSSSGSSLESEDEGDDEESESDSEYDENDDDDESDSDSDCFDAKVQKLLQSAPPAPGPNYM